MAESSLFLLEAPLGKDAMVVSFLFGGALLPEKVGMGELYVFLKAIRQEKVKTGALSRSHLGADQWKTQTGAFACSQNNNN